MIQKTFLGIFLFCIILISFISCSKENSSEEKPSVYIKENKGKYQLMRNDKLFYIKGGAAHPEYLEELKEAGANTARIYDTIDLDQVLDKAEALGLAVVVDIPLPKFDRDPQFYEDQELFEEMRRKIRPIVQKHKDHPALLYWNLGNELYYPYFYTSTKFFENFNSLIDLIHEEDPNHPVSTTTIGANKLRIVSIKVRSPELDFISFNSFGVLSSFREKLKPLEPFWNGPYVITEWGVNGPWEAQNTAWGVPIEETSTKKAEQVRERHENYIKLLKSNNSLGSFVFYWGQKVEFTPTWYSLFLDKRKSESVFQLQKIWKNTKREFSGPRLEFVLLNGKGAADDIVLSPNEMARAEVILPEVQEDLSYRWQILRESWYERLASEKYGPAISEGDREILFEAPQEEGPYRLHLTVTNKTNYYATANIPFYVLNPENEE